MGRIRAMLPKHILRSSTAASDERRSSRFIAPHLSCYGGCVGELEWRVGRLFEMHAASHSLVELPSDTMVLNEVGGRAELVAVFNSDAFGFIGWIEVDDFAPVDAASQSQLRRHGWGCCCRCTRHPPGRPERCRGGDQGCTGP